MVMGLGVGIWDLGVEVVGGELRVFYEGVGTKRRVLTSVSRRQVIIQRVHRSRDLESMFRKLWKNGDVLWRQMREVSSRVMAYAEKDLWESGEEAAVRFCRFGWMLMELGWGWCYGICVVLL